MVTITTIFFILLDVILKYVFMVNWLKFAGIMGISFILEIIVMIIYYRWGAGKNE